LEKNHNSKQGTRAKQATNSTDGKPSGSTSAKTPISCIGYEVFKTLSAQHKCPIHGKGGHNHQLGECQSLLFELNKRGFEVVRKDGKLNLQRANKASSKDKPAPETTPDDTSVFGIVAAGKMARSSTYAGAARQVSAPTATSSVATGTTADLDTLDSLDLDFGCSFMAETGPNNTRTDTTLYLAPPATHLEPPSSWFTGKLQWILIGLLVLRLGPWSILLSNMTTLLPQRWHCPSHIISTARHVEASQCLCRIAQVKTNPVTQACIDSSATSDMDPCRQVFTDYIKLTDCYVLVANNVKIPCLGRGSVSITLGDRPLLLRNILHVPALDMPLLSCCVHCRRGQGCSFVADTKGCFLTFPTFFLKIEDTHEYALPCEIGPRDGPYDYEDAPNTRRSRDASNPPYLAAKRAIGALLSLPTGKRCHVSRTSTPATDPALISTIPAVSPRKPQPATSRAREPPPVLPCKTPKSSAPSTKRYTPHDLHRLFGGRKLLGFKILAELGTGIKVKDSTDPLLSVCDAVNLKRGRHGKLLTPPKAALDVVGMDIRYGEGVSPGGYRYCRMLVDRKTRKTWVYGLPGMGGNSLCDALWRFFIDAGSFPRQIQSDFDPKFVGGHVPRLLRTHFIRLCASPPNRQSQNGLVESHWRVACGMARGLLAEAQRPKHYWFWAIHEAVLRMNLLPVQVPQSNVTKASSTPHELFYGSKPNYRVIFHWSSYGYYHRPQDGGRGQRTKYESKGFTGIALGRSDVSNALVFYNPTLQKFSTSADYLLDSNKSICLAFPSLHYDGGLHIRLYSDPKEDTLEPYPIGSPVFAQLSTTADGDKMIAPGTVVQIPCDSNGEELYRIRLDENQTLIPCDRSQLRSPDEPILSGTEDGASYGPESPEWCRIDSRLPSW
jgi:hypothetical protein